MKNTKTDQQKPFHYPFIKQNGAIDERSKKNRHLSIQDNPYYLTIEELSERWKVPKSWIYQRTRETGPNAIPRTKVGKYLRFEWLKVQEWLKTQNKEV